MGEYQLVVGRRLACDDYSGREGRRVQAVVLHITDGPSIESALAWWRRPDVQASAHWLVSAVGVAFPVVDEQEAAWTVGVVEAPDLLNPLMASWVAAGINPNTVTVNIEVVATRGQRWTPAQWRATAALIGAVCVRHGLPIDRTHVLGHHQISGRQRSACPGLSREEWSDLLQEARRLAEPAPEHDVGEGLRRALVRVGEQAATDETYFRAEQGDGQVSVVWTRRGRGLCWLSETGQCYRLEVI